MLQRKKNRKQTHKTQQTNIGQTSERHPSYPSNVTRHMISLQVNCTKHSWTVRNWCENLSLRLHTILL